MKAAGSGALLAAMALAALAATGLAKDQMVGGSNGWDTFIDYDKWVAGETFVVSDTISAHLLRFFPAIFPHQQLSRSELSSYHFLAIWLLMVHRSIDTSGFVQRSSTSCTTTCWR
jgi:hypothetical protein